MRYVNVSAIGFGFILPFNPASERKRGEKHKAWPSAQLKLVYERLE
jgi:hypothetical protein